MKFCPECGTKIEGMKFCPECGFKNTEEGSQSQSMPAQPQSISQIGDADRDSKNQIQNSQEQTVLIFESKPTITKRAVQDVAAKAGGKVDEMKQGLRGKIKPADGIIDRTDIEEPAIRHTLTTQRLITDKIGILSKETSEVNLEDIAEVSFTQGLSEKMLGHGTITLHLADGSEVKLARIENHREIRETIRTTVIKRKQELTALSNATYMKVF